MTYNLENHGDYFEQEYFNKFIKKEFPEYELYWKEHVVPLSNRPHNNDFKSEHELLNIDNADERICLAQMHYTLLKHLIRAFDIKEYFNQLDLHFSFDGLDNLFIEGIFRITSAQDLAFEFLERRQNPKKYDPWIEKSNSKKETKKGSEEARRCWQKNNKYPLKEIREYRNRLAHGRMHPYFLGERFIYYPKFENLSNYLDWRLKKPFDEIRKDFEPMHVIYDEAWKKTVNYINLNWKQIRENNR